MRTKTEIEAALNGLAIAHKMMVNEPWLNRAWPHIKALNDLVVAKHPVRNGFFHFRLAPPPGIFFGLILSVLLMIKVQ